MNDVKTSHCKMSSLCGRILNGYSFCFLLKEFNVSPHMYIKRGDQEDHISISNKQFSLFNCFSLYSRVFNK
jgi:hypothetical protein